MLVTKSDNKLTDLAGKSETGVDDQKQNNLNEEKTLVLTSTATKNRFSPLCRQVSYRCISISFMGIKILHFFFYIKTLNG